MSSIEVDTAWTPEERDTTTNKPRTCKNVTCLIVLILFLICWIIVGVYAFSNAQFRSLMEPTNSNGLKCGEDRAVKDKPYLFYLDWMKCVNNSYSEKYQECNIQQICVEECPKSNFVYDVYKNYYSVESTKKKLICQHEISISNIVTFERIRKYIEQEKCAEKYLYSQTVWRRCIPVAMFTNLTTFGITFTDLKNVQEIMQRKAELDGFTEQIFSDVRSTMYSVLGFIILSGAVSVLHILFLRWFANVYTYIIVFSVFALLAYVIYEVSINYIEYRYTSLLIVLILCCALFAIILLLIFYQRESLASVYVLLTEASKAILSVASTFILPVTLWIFHLLVVVCGTCIFMYLLNVKTPIYRVDSTNDKCICAPGVDLTHNATCDPVVYDKKCKENGLSCGSSVCVLVGREKPWFLTYLHIVNVIGIYWFYLLVAGIGEMTLAATFSTWYWTFKKRDVPYYILLISAWRTTRYHLGTAALGSALITPCKIINSFVYSTNYLIENKRFVCFSALEYCCKILSIIFEKFIKYTNNNGYIISARDGSGFWDSAKQAFDLIERNVHRVIDVNRMTRWLLLLNKLLITTVISAVCYSYNSRSSINYWQVPVLLTATGSFLTATIFFSVMTVTMDSVFLCFLKDGEDNKGSAETPYFMNNNLKKLLRR